MCIHLFNPPSPNCVAQMPTPCNNCHCVPRYWRLDSPAFTYEESTYDASWIVLEADPVRGESVCLWTHRADIPQGVTTGVPRERGENDYFAGLTRWRLASRAGLQLRSPPNPQVVFEEWVIYQPGRVAYTVQRDSLQNLVFHKHFNCLGPTTFKYNVSAGDFEGTDPLFNGYPPTLTVTPYHP